MESFIGQIIEKTTFLTIIQYQHGLYVDFDLSSFSIYLSTVIQDL